MKYRLKIRKKSIHLSILSVVGSDTVFEGQNAIGSCTYFSGSMGYGSYISLHSYLPNTKIGRYTCIAGKVRAIIGQHPSHTFVSVNPMFYSLHRQTGATFVTTQKYNENRYVDPEKKYQIEIGNDVWIGEGARIMEGVVISDGAIVAAGALVTKNVEPYSIVGGVPAKTIKKRFTEDQISYLLKYKWWDMPQDWIKEHVDLFEDIDLFISNTRK